MGLRFLSVGIMAATLAAATPVPVCAQETSAIQVWDAVLAASVARLSSESPSWRQAMETIGSTGRRAVLTTPDKVRGDFDRDALAQAVPLPDAQANVDTVLVVVNLDLLRNLSGLPSTAIDFEDDLDRILAHEVYGHAVPLLLAGTMAGKCADPIAGQSAVASCAIQRENVIRSEMSLGRRFEYGSGSLAIARRYW